MKIPFAGGHYETFSKPLNAQECINFYSHMDREGGSSELSLRGTPGLKEWCDIGAYAAVRGLKKMGNYLYAVVGNTVYKISPSGIPTTCTGSLGTSSGRVSMDTNGTQLMIVDGVKGYILAGVTVTQITDDAFPPNPTTVTYQDGYFIVSVFGSGRGYISDLNDGTSWDGTMYFNAEADPDNTLALLSDHRDLIMFGSDTLEFWYNSGNTVPFDRKPGYFQEVGLGAKDSPAQLENTVYFLSNHYQIVRFEGPQPKPVSTWSVEYQISQYSKKDDAIGMGVMIEGQAFYILTFPTAGETWCFNAATGLFSRLASYPEPYDNIWRGNCHEYFNGMNIIGDYQNGKLYEWDFETYTDDSETIRRVRTAPAVRKEGKRIRWDTLEIFFESGVGLDEGAQGDDPQAMLQVSNDGGQTWGNEMWRSVGEIGKYRTRAMWKRLGAARHRNVRLTVTDPVKWVVIDANLEAEIGVA